MAFKMKGSAFKLNNVATKSALAAGKSPLEQQLPPIEDDPRKNYGGVTIASTGNPDFEATQEQKVDSEAYRLDMDATDEDYLNQLKEIANKHGITLQQAHQRAGKTGIRKNIRDLSNKELNKLMREEKQKQDERMEGAGNEKRKYYKKSSGVVEDEEGQRFKTWGPKIPRPKWWSSRDKKEDYIKTMQGRQIPMLPKKSVERTNVMDENQNVEFGYFDKEGNVK